MGSREYAAAPGKGESSFLVGSFRFSGTLGFFLMVRMQAATGHGTAFCRTRSLLQGENVANLGRFRTAIGERPPSHSNAADKTELLLHGENSSMKGKHS